MPEKILVVEDELSLRETLAYNLKKEGYTVETVGDGRAALEAARRLKPDLLVLDIMLPEIDGFEVARVVRKEMTAAILMLTARDDEIDRVVGLEVGADDYLTKPFSMRELLARVKVLFRRAAIDQNTAPRAAADAPVRNGDLELDLQRYSVRWKGLPVSLTVTEFMMLHALVRYPGHVKTRKQLHQDGYPHDAYVSDRTIDSHIKRVRKKFRAIDDTFTAIETLYGIGYRYKEN